jgi:hypothetical protein
MTAHKPPDTSRRRFLTGLGGITLALPWLEQLASPAFAQAGSGPRRVIVVTYAMGVPLRHWRPALDMTLPYVTAPLEPFKDRTLFVSALDNTVLETGGDPFVWGHPAKQEAALTGTLTTGAFPAANSNHVDEVRQDAAAEGGANNASVEHLIGEFLHSGQPLRSVDVGIDGDAMVEWGGQTPAQPSLFCFEGRGNPISVNLHPSATFNSLFGGLDTGEGTSAQQDELRRLRLRNKSVLDAVREGFAELQVGLSSDDRRRLEEHAERIRRIELDLQLTESCVIPQGIESASSTQGLRMDQIAPLQIQILARAMGCNLAPVGRLDFANQQSPRFGIPDLDATLDAVAGETDWHGMVHGDPLPGTEVFLRPGRDESVTEYDQRLLDGYRFFVEQYTSLLTELDAISEGPDTTVLDNSLVVLASDLGEGHGHHHGKMGYILAGNLGGATPGVHLDAMPETGQDPSSADFYTSARYNVNQLLNSMLDMAGVVDDVGEPVTMGLDGYLESIGAPRRIDDLFG